ncbi:MAG: pirin family protein [Bryobacteraceae bacterium]|nr:pirin family protein [Bryobacteraceae bacterium]
MITVRKSEDRGHADHGWLKTYHTFSFNTYYDPAHTHFRTLRVINDDVVLGGQGFGMHPHKDMEILTWVLDGALEHADSQGGKGVIRPGEIQRMSAGTGIFHSEYNHSKTDAVRLLQIWLFPETKGLKPGYEQKAFSDEELTGKFTEVASPNPVNGAVKIHQDAKLLVARLRGGDTASHELAPGRSGWLQVAKGSVTLNGVELQEGDGAAIQNEVRAEVAAKAPAEVLLFDLN